MTGLTTVFPRAVIGVYWPFRGELDLLDYMGDLAGQGARITLPVVGADRAGYRLGYGGGFYDRTLASLPNRVLTIGVGHPVAEINSIFPQPHDVPLDWILLGEMHWERPR